MRKALISLSLLVLAACATPAGNADSTAREQVAAATDAWRAAYDSRDLARITGAYAPDAVFWGTTMKTVATTPAAVQEYFKDAPTRPNARVVFGEQQIRVYGDTAVNTGTYTFSDNRDGKATTTPARFSMVFNKRGGRWVMVSHHSSRLPQ